MALIEWDDTYSIGLEMIDAQHRRWIQIINDLDDVLNYGDADKLQRIKRETLDAMIDYTRYHFSCEEQLMERMRYPDIEAHQEAHRRMSGILSQVKIDSTRGYEPLNTQLMSLMMDWLKDHILDEDKQYGRFAANCKMTVRIVD